MKVTGEEVFSVPTTAFAVSPSNEGYTLNYSADAVGFTAIDEATPANEVAVFNDIAKGMVFKLVGNASEVYIQY